MAFRPPETVRGQLSEFLTARPELPWIDPEQWHVTLAFMESVPERATEELLERLAAGFARQTAPTVKLEGAGCLPEPFAARILYLRVPETAGSVRKLAITARNAANKSGANPDGRRFLAHLTLARLKRPIHAVRWLQILDTFASEPWAVRSVDLIASHLGEGPARRPRYELVAKIPLGTT